MKNLIGIEDINKEELEELIETAKEIMKDKEKYIEKCKGKILATLFFEPSTRTRLSFESAMLSLGGNVLGFSEANNSSITKGETVADTIKVVSGYADIIVMRHPKEGAPIVAQKNSKVPIINAGDGGHNHPTQTLTDLLTISKEKGKIENLTIGICGDLKFGRTVHSLVTALTKYKNIKFIFISPEELKMPNYIKKEILENNKIEYKETNNLEESIHKLDILYMTRVQKERFANEEEYNKLKDYYILDKEKMKNAKKDLSILHPLPRVNEISIEIDEDPRACYFKQAENGRYIRMALILKLLGKIESNIKEDEEQPKKEIINKIKCENPRCITTTERGINQICYETKDKKYRCKYCDSNLK